MLLSITSFFGDHGVTWLSDWLPLTIFVLIITFTIYGTLLAISRAFYLKQLERFALSEIFQTASTAFMAIFLVVMVGSALEVAGQAIEGEVSCPQGSVNIQPGDSSMDQAYEAIRCRLQGRAKELADAQGSILSGTASEFNLLNLQISILGITAWKGDWDKSLYQETEEYRIVNNLATVMIIGLNAQNYLLQYLQINMLHIFIPVGILMRAFYFTRAPGALLISLGIGMYFIFPVFFVLLDPGFVSVPSAPSPAQPAQPQIYCYPTMSNAVSMLETMETQGFGSTSSLSLSQIRNNLAKYYVNLIIHPLIAFFLTMVFVRYMMSILGGDTQELTKMIMKVV